MIIHNEELEKSLLSCVMRDTGLLTGLSADLFNNLVCKKVFEAIQAEKTGDVVLLASKSQIPASTFLGIYNSSISNAQAHQYIKELQRLSRLRKIYTASQELVHTMETADEVNTEKLEHALLSDTQPLENTKPATEIAQKILAKDKQEKKFFTWGSQSLDYDLPVIEYHTYLVMFGQAGSGKTSFAMSMARSNKNVCLLTLEMSREKLIRQYAFRRAGVDKEKYKRGEYDRGIFEEYAKELNNILILGVDEDSTKQDYTCNDIEQIVKRDDVDILFIDNFNKLIGQGTSDVGSDNNTSSRLLFMTRQYNVAIVVIHHTNKPTAQRNTALRGVKGMRGTNKLVDDADIVCELGRDMETNTTKLAIYKDRDWDAKNGIDLQFQNGLFVPMNGITYSGIDDITF